MENENVMLIKYCSVMMCASHLLKCLFIGKTQ